MKYIHESFQDFLNENNKFSLCESCGGNCDSSGVCESCGEKHINEEELFPDILKVKKRTKITSNANNPDWEYIPAGEYKSTRTEFDGMHIYKSNGKKWFLWPEDMDILNESVNEARVQYKRRYTENHPARTMNSNTKIRSKFLSAIGDGVLTEDEIYNILKELNANSKWFQRNSSLVKQTADGYRLSVEGKRMLKHVQVANTVNEENPVIESKDLKAQAFDALKKMKDPTDESKPFDVKSVDSVKDKKNSYEVKYTSNKGRKESIVLYDFDLNESFIANPDDAVEYVIDNYKKITGEDYNPSKITDKTAGKIERFVKKQGLDTDDFWDSWIEYNHV